MPAFTTMVEITDMCISWRSVPKVSMNRLDCMFQAVTGISRGYLTSRSHLSKDLQDEPQTMALEIGPMSG